MAPCVSLIGAGGLAQGWGGENDIHPHKRTQPRETVMPQRKPLELLRVRPDIQIEIRPVRIESQRPARGVVGGRKEETMTPSSECV